MNKKILLMASATLLGWSLSNASVTDVTWNSYSGGIICYSPVWDSTGNIGIDGYQTGAGQMGGTITTSDALDPILTLANAIDNDSSFAWTEYKVSVSMNNSFSILSAAATAPPGWTANITQPGAPVAGVYTGMIDYLGGVPVAIVTDPNNPPPNSELDFSYKVQFSGSTSYSLTESVTPVPEPGVFSLLMSGGLLLGGWMIAKRRQAKLCVRA